MPASQSPPPAVARARARVAVNVREGRHEAADEARLDLRAATLEAHIAREIEKLPPLTDAQRERLAAMLRAGAA